MDHLLEYRTLPEFFLPDLPKFTLQSNLDLLLPPRHKNGVQVGGPYRRDHGGRFSHANSCGEKGTEIQSIL